MPPGAIDFFGSPLQGKAPRYATEDHPVWEVIRPRDGKGGFERHEFTRPDEMDVGFLHLLYEIRQLAGVPIRVISDARPTGRDVGANLSAHKKRPCRAIDIGVRNRYERGRVLVAAIRCGIVRVGVYPGDLTKDGGGLHIDAETSAENPSPRCWTNY